MTIAEPIAETICLDNTSVGRLFAHREVEIDFTSSALYAAAIGSERGIYLDERLLNQGMAPPAFVTSLEWPLVSGAECLAALGIPRAEFFPRLLHLYQDSTFAAPIRPGDRLMLEATLESVSSARSGAVVAVRIRTTDRRARTLVAESWFGAYFRDMTVRRSKSARTAPTIPFVESQSAIDRQVISIPRSAAYVYSDCARLENPIHTSVGFAKRLGYPDLVLHGSLMWAKMGEALIDRHLQGHPERLRRLAARFRRPLLPDRIMTLDTFMPEPQPGQAAMHLRDQLTGEMLCEGWAEFGLT